MSNLVIVESPAKAATIKEYLGSNYKVVASVGHVRDLPKSTLGVDIDNGFEAHYINIRGKGDLIKSLQKDAKAANAVYLATDADREGEAIAWHLATALDIPISETRRVTFNEISKAAVKKGIKEPRNIDMDLVNSQQARRILDRIVGYKLSPYLWKTVRSGLSAGRVQSVATRIIVEREEEISAFVPKEFWVVNAVFETSDGKTFKAKYFGCGKKTELTSEKAANAVLDAVKDGKFSVVSVKKAAKTKNPAPPFSTSTMQQEANHKLGFASARTMKIAQELYEGINLGSKFGGTQGLITYMRTDSLRISDEACEKAREYILSTYGDKYCPAKPRVYKAKAGAQDAHEAIRPVNLAYTPDKIKAALSNDQYKLYKLIFERFVASQMASAIFDTVNADIECASHVFKAGGYTVRFPGFMSLYYDTSALDEEGERVALPELCEGEEVKADEIKSEQHFTEPPSRFTEATLLKFLEEKGIGRPSTWAQIITTIQERGYVAREGKALRPTPLGQVTTELMKDNFPDVVDYKFTAQMEDRLDSIENGNESISEVLGSFYDGFDRDLSAAFERAEKEKVKVPDEETDIICDKCGAKMVIKTGRFGKFAACPNYPECKNTKPLAKDGKTLRPEKPKAKETDMVCEKCGAPMVMRSGRYGSFFACSKFPECSFTKQQTTDTGVKCPECGGAVLTRRSKKNNIFYSCSNYPECKFSSWDLPTNEKCPVCGGMLFYKKSRNTLICRAEGCGYSRIAEETFAKTQENIEKAD